MSTVEFKNVSKAFPGGTGNAVDNFNLSIASGEFVSFLGPSGCGKTTSLRMLAGLERNTGGRILIDGVVVAEPEARVFVPPEKRHVGMVFQSYAVWPHMNVFDNVAYPLKIARMPKVEIATRVNEMLEVVELGGLEKRMPSQLSGGQQQRVALARGLVMRPKVLLLDEPLSNLDAKLRGKMRTDIRAIQQKLKLTVVYVTHDQLEANTMSDRMVIMRSGRVFANRYTRPNTPISSRRICGRLYSVKRNFLMMDLVNDRPDGYKSIVSDVCAALTMLVGVLVMTGWLAGIPFLKSVLPGFITMKFNTAVCLTLSGLVLTVANRFRSRSSEAFTTICSSIVLAIVLLTLAEYLLDIKVRLDELFVSDPDGYTGRFPPGRLAPITAVNFVFFLTALLVQKFRSEKAVFIAQGFAVVVLFSAFQSLLGNAVGLNNFFGVAFYTQMALHTSLSFALLAIGFLALRPDDGLMQSLTSKTAASISMRWVLIGAVLVPVCVRTLAQLGFNAHWYDQDFLQIFQLVGITAAMTTIVGIISSFRLKAEKEAEAKHEAALESRALAESANLARGQLLANVSHEIRTPLGAIIGFTELLKQPETTGEERREYFDILERNSANLLRLIDDILDLSKVEAGKIALERRIVGLPEILLDVQKLMSIKAIEKGLSLTVSSISTIPDRIEIDSLRLRQILVNLIGNAVKFTDHGTIKVAVSYEGSFLKVTVIDTGIGISTEQAARLFQMFSQSDPSMTRTHGGTGLGLVLSKRLAQALGGDLNLTWSTVGLGSAFTVVVLAPAVEHSVRIDLKPSTVSKEVSPVIETKRKILDSLRVLVVDDSEDNRTLVSIYLRGVGAEVQTATNGEDGVKAALSNSPDVILMDVQMPVLDGREATRALRASGFSKPIIALTAHAMREERDRCLEAGCNDYLTKPIDKSALIEVLARYSASKEKS